MSRSPLVGALAVTLGCSGAPDAPGVASSDIRIDMASASNDPDSGDTRMCVDPSGGVYVVWTDERDGTSDVWMNRSIDRGSSWLPAAVRVNQGDGNAVHPSIACTTEGVYVVWEDDRDGELENRQIYFNRSEDGGVTWEQDDLLLENDVDGLTMSLGPAITAVGTDLYVAWFDSANGAYDIFVISSGNGGAEWRSPVRVDTDAPGEAYSAWPQIEGTEFGEVYVVWEDARHGANDVYFAMSDNAGQSFQDDERLDKGDDAGANDSFAPRLGVSGDHLYVVWHDARNGEGRDVFYQYSSNGGKSWLDVSALLESDAEGSGNNPGFHNSIFPDLEVAGSTAHVAWQDARAEGYDIFYRGVVAGVVGADEVRVESDPEGHTNSVNAKVAFGNGKAVVAWEDARAEEAQGGSQGYNDLYYNFTADGGASFNETDLRIDSMAPGQSFKVDMNIEVSGGEIYVAWTDGRNGTADIYFQAMEIGSEAQYIEQEGEAQSATTTP